MPKVTQLQTRIKTNSFQRPLVEQSMGLRIQCPLPPGYANEVGEAFRSLVPKAVVWLSYGVASSYVLADAIDKGKKAGEVSVSFPSQPPPKCTGGVGVALFAALLMVKSLGDSPYSSPVYRRVYLTPIPGGGSLYSTLGCGQVHPLS